MKRRGEGKIGAGEIADELVLADPNASTGTTEGIEHGTLPPPIGTPPSIFNWSTVNMFPMSKDGSTANAEPGL